MYVISCYIAYLVICLTVTVWVAHTLHKNGRVFLVDAFHGDAGLADSVNHLLVVGFYLINVGYVALALSTTQEVVSLRQTFEMVSDKVGLVLLVLGGMHFFNLYVFSRIRKRSRPAPTYPLRHVAPPVPQPPMPQPTVTPATVVQPPVAESPLPAGYRSRD